MEPTGEPTSEPTTEPTTEPTGEPTGEPTTGTSLTPLQDLGQNPSVTLGHCQGDCDGDSDCEPGFTCYNNEVPPGCYGTMTYTWYDYCGDPNWDEDDGFVTTHDGFVSTVPTAEPTTEPTTAKPTLLVIPTLRRTVMPMVMPTVMPTEQPTVMPTVIPTVMPTTEHPTEVPSTQSNDWYGNDSGDGNDSYTETVQTELTELQHLGWDPNVTLGHCEGDCDGDSDCESGMICYHDQVPPGCTGESNATSFDFCGDPNWNVDDSDMTYASSTWKWVNEVREGVTERGWQIVDELASDWKQMPDTVPTSGVLVAA